MKKHVRRSILWASMLIFLLFPYITVSAHAATGNGRIFGQLLDGSNNNALLPGQSVTLQMVKGTSSGQDVASVTTDAQGSFSFNNLAVDKDISYVVYSHFQGGQYVSDAASLNSNPVQQLNVTAYESTTDATKIAVQQATMLIRAPNAQTGMITISEAFSLVNLDKRTFVGSLDASRGKPNALLFSLPSLARSINLGSGFAGYQVIQVNNGFATNAAVLPGSSDFSFSFDVPYSTSSYDLSYTTMYPTAVLTVMVAPEIQVNASALKSQGEITASDQHTYRLFTASALLANKDIHIGLNGLSLPQSTVSSNPLSGNTAWLIVCILLMLAILGVTWFIYRARRRRAAIGEQGEEDADGAKDTTSQAGGVSKKASGAPVDQRKVLLQKLLELDKEYEAGKLTKAGYEERRSKTKARLRALISEQETARR